MIGILSDAHGNNKAFTKMCEVLFDLGANRLLFLGDAVGYIPSLSVLDSLMALGDKVTCIQGNHEEMLLSGSYPSRLESVYRLAGVREQITNEQKMFIEQWPKFRIEKFGSGSALFVHGSPSDYQNGYVYPDTNLDVFDVDHDFVFMGHTHRAFQKKSSGTTYTNVGSCGLPRDDGRYASAALFEPESGLGKIIRLDLSTFSTEEFFTGFEVHHSVKGLFDRREHNIEGEIIAIK